LLEEKKKLSRKIGKVFHIIEFNVKEKI